MTPEDRLRVRDAVERCPERHVIITHGTDTMIDTALQLLDIPEKCVVLTGPCSRQISEAVMRSLMWVSPSAPFSP